MMFNDNYWKKKKKEKKCYYTIIWYLNERKKSCVSRVNVL